MMQSTYHRAATMPDGRWLKDWLYSHLIAFTESAMSARRYLVKELALAAAHVAQLDKIISVQRSPIAQLKSKSGNSGHAEGLLEEDVR
jgi:hypothetical protein